MFIRKKSAKIFRYLLIHVYFFSGLLYGFDYVKRFGGLAIPLGVLATGGLATYYSNSSPNTSIQELSSGEPNQDLPSTQSDAALTLKPEVKSSVPLPLASEPGLVKEQSPSALSVAKENSSIQQPPTSSAPTPQPPTPQSPTPPPSAPQPTTPPSVRPLPSAVERTHILQKGLEESRQSALPKQESVLPKQEKDKKSFFTVFTEWINEKRSPLDQSGEKAEVPSLKTTAPQPTASSSVPTPKDSVPSGSSDGPYASERVMRETALSAQSTGSQIQPESVASSASSWRALKWAKDNWLLASVVTGGLLYYGGKYAWNWYQENLTKRELTDQFYKEIMGPNGLQGVETIHDVDLVFEKLKDHDILEAEKVEAIRSRLTKHREFLAKKAEEEVRKVQEQAQKEKADVLALQKQNEELQAEIEKLKKAFALNLKEQKVLHTPDGQPQQKESVIQPKQPVPELPRYSEEHLQRMFLAAQRNSRGLNALKDPHNQAILKAMLPNPLVQQMLDFAAKH